LAAANHQINKTAWGLFRFFRSISARLVICVVSLKHDESLSEIMCYFITISIPKTGIKFAQEKIPREIHLSETSNPSLEGLLPKDYVNFLVITGGCSCDLFNEDDLEANKEDVIKKLTHKYKKKGWTENKIKKAVSQSISNSSTGGNSGLRDDLKFFLSDIALHLKEIRIIVHWYGGAVDQEKIKTKESPTISPYELRTQNIIKEIDTIYKIKG